MMNGERRFAPENLGELLGELEHLEQLTLRPTGHEAGNAFECTMIVGGDARPMNVGSYGETPLEAMLATFELYWFEDE